MPVNVHEAIQQDQTLWRYMNLEKLLWMLQHKALYFVQLKEFPDHYEGAAPIRLQWDCKVGEAPVLQRIKDDQMPDHIYVNCWHSNADESAAMWSLYSGRNGVAVVTTLDHLRSALKDAPQKIEIAAVDYEAITPGFAAGSPWTIKRPSFAHEREVRAVFRDPECGQTGVRIPVDVGVLIDRIQVSPECEPWIEGVVADVVAKYGIAATVKRSDLYTLH